MADSGNLLFFQPSVMVGSADPFFFPLPLDLLGAILNVTSFFSCIRSGADGLGSKVRKSSNKLNQKWRRRKMVKRQRGKIDNPNSYPAVL